MATPVTDDKKIGVLMIEPEPIDIRRIRHEPGRIIMEASRAGGPYLDIAIDVPPQQDLFSPPSVPYARKSATSRAAADSIRPLLSAMEQRVYEAFVRAGPRGLTTDEAEVLLDMRHQTVSARVNGLTNKGMLLLTDERRPTRSGRQAGVYCVKATP